MTKWLIRDHMSVFLIFNLVVIYSSKWKVVLWSSDFFYQNEIKSVFQIFSQWSTEWQLSIGENIWNNSFTFQSEIMILQQILNYLKQLFQIFFILKMSVLGFVKMIIEKNSFQIYSTSVCSMSFHIYLVSYRLPQLSTAALSFLEFFKQLHILICLFNAVGI